MSDPLDELFGEADVISAREFGDHCGITYASALALCDNFGVTKFGPSYAITRDSAEEMIEAIDEALEAAETDSEDDPDHDPDDPDCDCADCSEDEADDH